METLIHHRRCHYDRAREQYFVCEMYALYVCFFFPHRKFIYCKSQHNNDYQCVYESPQVQCIEVFTLRNSQQFVTTSKFLNIWRCRPWRQALRNGSIDTCYIQTIFYNEQMFAMSNIKNSFWITISATMEKAKRLTTKIIS